MLSGIHVSQLFLHLRRNSAVRLLLSLLLQDCLDFFYSSERKIYKAPVQTIDVKILAAASERRRKMLADFDSITGRRMAPT